MPARTAMAESLETVATTRTSARCGPARVSLTSVRDAHELFVTGQVDGSYLESIPLPRLVTDSWQRSLATGVDPDRGPGEAAAATQLTELRNSHPLARALPVIRRLLVDHAADSGALVGVTAADGALLWVEGDSGAGRKAAAMNFVPGADWSERAVGTNAPGTALALDREVQIRGANTSAGWCDPGRAPRSRYTTRCPERHWGVWTLPAVWTSPPRRPWRWCVRRRWPSSISSPWTIRGAFR